MLAAILFIALVRPPAALPDVATVRQWFEAGDDRRVVAVAVDDASAPSLIFLVARSHDRLTQRAQARAAYERLTGRPETDPWHFVGRAATLLADAQLAEALSAAERAVALGATVAETHFQLGLVQAERRDYGKAAPAFEAAIAIDPMPAYTHYYAGLSYYQAERIDLMADFFESFLKLAPNAPERTQVESIMRTIRGRR